MNGPGASWLFVAKAVVGLALLTLCVPARAATACCRCSNGREETIALAETDTETRATCADICVRQSIMDQRVEVERVAAGSCPNDQGQPAAEQHGGAGTTER